MARRPGQQDDKHHHHCLVRRCLAIVLRRVSDDGSPELKEGSAEVSRRRIRTRRPSTISAEERRGDEGPGPPDETGIADGSVTFGELVRENSECYWNPCLVQSVNNLEYKGYITPATLLIAGTEYSLEVVRSAWARRVLRPPRGFDILMMGDLESVEMGIISQTHFAPLPEALCKVVYDLTSEGTIATMTVITDRLKTAFPELVVPEHNILYRTLGTLIRERKLYHTGHGYSVVTPETYRLMAVSPPLERQMLLTNEEAIVRLHGTAVTLDTEDSELCRSAFTQTNQKDMVSAWSSAERILAPSKQGSSEQKVGRLKRSHSLRLLRGKEKEKLIRSNSFRSPTTSPFLNRESRSDPENHEIIKKEKSSMFSKLFRRGRTDKSSPKAPKCASFSAQFPPLEWSDPDFVHFHSRATQTLDRDVVKSKTRSSSLNRMSSRERHSLHLSSTPVGTPWMMTNSNNTHAADIYHYRSSSLPRKSSPSPNREGVRNHSTRKSPKSSRPQHQHEPQCRVPVTAKPRARYQSPFVPVVSPSNNRNLLKPGERYADANTLQTSNVLPYRPLSFSSIPSTTLKQTSTPSSFRLSTPPSVSAPTWRTTLLPPTSEQKLAVGEPLKKPPIVVLPQRPVAREVASVQPSTASTTTTTTLQPTIIETESKKIVGNPMNISSTREVHLGGTVDVQISVEPKISTQMKKGVLNTDLDSDVNKDLLKIAATWNHSISNKSPVGKAGITNSSMNPTVTTTTSITTSLSHKGLKKEGHKITTEIPQKDISIVTNSSEQTLKKSSLIDCTEKCNLLNDLEENKLHLEPRSKMADAKAAFFAESPTPSQQLMKDDSGFSSSASTSRPMSVSPC